MMPGAPLRGQFLKVGFWFGGFCLFWFIVLAFAVRWSTQSIQLWVTVPFLTLPVLLLFPSSLWLHSQITTVDILCKQFLGGAVVVYGCAFIMTYLWIFLLRCVLAFMGFEDIYSWKSVYSGMSLGECLLWALIAMPIPQALVAFFAILHSKPGEDAKNYPVNALYLGAGYAVSAVVIWLQLQVYGSDSAGVFSWSLLVSLAMELMTLEAPVQMLACYAVGLLVKSDVDTRHPVNKFRGVAAGWIVRAVYFLVSFLWNTGYLVWWAFLPIASLELLLFVLWAFREETKGLIPSHRPSGPFRYDVQAEEMVEPTLQPGNPMPAVLLPPGVAVGVPCTGIPCIVLPQQQAPAAYCPCQAV